MSMLICPVCKQPLQRQPHCYTCQNGHNFDRAKSGYVNLLQSQKQHQKRHGDDKAMVQARTRFLNGGYYANLQQAVVQAALNYAGNASRILDVGCGECYYTQAVAAAMPHATQVCGVDISKQALIAAARRNSQFDLAVASLYHLPIADGGCDLLLNIFAPHAEEEFARVLAPGGIYLWVIPLQNHLWQLKQAVYTTPRKNTVAPYPLAGFELIGEQQLCSQIAINNPQDIQDLFMMTPYYYKTGKAEQQRLAALNTLVTDTQFALLIYCRQTA